jgi:hypothetical protein
MKKFDVTALGELLIDFTDNGKSAQGNTLFEANPGGAPCNVLAMLNKCANPAPTTMPATKTAESPSPSPARKS